MEFEGKNSKFSHPVKIHGMDEDGLIHNREELSLAVGGFFGRLTESRQQHLTKRLSEVIECMLAGRRPRNMVDVTGNAGNRRITHLYMGRTRRREPFEIYLRWNLEQIPPLEIISIRWSPQITINYGRHNASLEHRRRRRAAGLLPDSADSRILKFR